MYLVKVFQYKKGTTCKTKRVGDVLIEGRTLGPNQTCVTHMLTDVTQERAQAFVKEWLGKPLGLTKTSLTLLQSDSEQFINSGVTGIKFLDAYTKKKNRVEIFIQCKGSV